MTRRMRSRRGDAGQAMVELALALPVALLILLGTLEVSRAVWQQNTLAMAVREGARYASLHGSGSDAPVGPAPLSGLPAQDVVLQNAIGVASVTVTVTWPDGNNDRGSRVVVAATSRFVPLAMLAPLAVTLNGSSTVVIER